MLKLLGSAAALELGALGLLATGDSATATLLGYLPLHAGASALAALGCLPLMPRPYRTPRRLVLLMLFAVNLLVPVIGLAVLLVGVLLGNRFPNLLQPTEFESVGLPEFTAAGDDTARPVRGAEARARLLNRNAPLAAREEALMALSATGVAGSGNLLREMLADPTDDLRLLAYGMLDRREREITARLAAERRLLQLAESIDDRDSARVICGRLAQLYWELVYQGLAQGDNARFALEQTLIFAERSLSEQPSDGPTWLMIGRVRLARGELRAAEGAFKEALAYQMPRRSVLPYLAELRFAQRRYRDVRTLMRELGTQPGSATLGTLQDFWAF